MFIEIPANTKITFINTDDLAPGWRDDTNYEKCQAAGNRWYNEGKTLLLKVPSAVLPESFNYVINTVHTDYKKVKLIETTNLVPDKRIEEILKKYSKK